MPGCFHYMRYPFCFKNILQTISLVSLIFFFYAIKDIGICAEYERENAIVRAVRKASPAVVNINSENNLQGKSYPFPGFGMDPFFDSFFKDFFDPEFERRGNRQNLGSGVIIDGKRGYILTNSHVIEKTGSVKVVLKDEREFEAQIVGADPDSDLAVLRISSPKSLPFIEMGNSDDLMIGETVIAIGNPFGFSNTVTTGVISALNRSIRAEDKIYHDFVQIDASINPGNSGGPLLNINGDLIGINTAIYANAQGIGFAIPIKKARRIIFDLIQYGEVIEPWIGISVQGLDTKLSNYMQVQQKKGVLVKEVEKNSPSAKAGIRPGDILLSVGTKNITSTDNYLAALRDFKIGDAINISLWRNRNKLSLSVIASEFPLKLAKELAVKLLGIKVNNVSSFAEPFKRNMPSKEGVVISEISSGSYLAKIGAKQGDIIRQIDELSIKNVEDFNKALVKYREKKALVVLLQRSDQLYYITVRI